MADQVVSFVANVDKPPLPPGVSDVLKFFKWAIGILMLAPATVYVAIANVGFLAGPSQAMGWPGALIIGVGSAIGLAVLGAAAGITWNELRPVSIAAIVLLVMCALLSFESAGGFAYVTSHPLPVHEIPDPRFDNEPRHVESVDRDMATWMSHEREHRFRDWIVITNGTEILSRTSQCTAFRHIWEHSECEQWAYLQAERKKAVKLYGQTESTSLGVAAIFSPEALAFGRHYSAWHVHIAAVLFTALCLPIMFGVSYVLTKGPGVATSPQAAPVVNKGPTERAFEEWSDHYLVLDTSHDAPAALLYLAYQLWCAAKGYPQYEDGDAFGRKLRPHVRAKFASVATEKSKGLIVYTGLNLRDDEFTQKARITFANGA